MNRIILFLFFIVSLSSYGQKYSLSSVQKNENGVTISLEEKQIEISFLKDNIIQMLYLQPIITQYFIDNKSEIWLLFLIAHSKR